MLSEELESLHLQILMAYTDNPSGVLLTPEDIAAILSRLAKMQLKAVELEQLIPPPPPKIEGDNVVDFQNARNTKTQRRI